MIFFYLVHILRWVWQKIIALYKKAAVLILTIAVQESATLVALRSMQLIIIGIDFVHIVHDDLFLDLKWDDMQYES